MINTSHTAREMTTKISRSSFPCRNHIRSIDEIILNLKTDFQTFWALRLTWAQFQKLENKQFSKGPRHVFIVFNIIRGIENVRKLYFCNSGSNMKDLYKKWTGKRWPRFFLHFWKCAQVKRWRKISENSIFSNKIT